MSIDVGATSGPVAPADQSDGSIAEVIGTLPYRMAFAGGWIDQPFVSRHNPEAPGSMVVVAIEPTLRFMDRAGMGTSTRRIAAQIWNGRLPEVACSDTERRMALVRELYEAENQGEPEPSGSQDMIGLIYPGVNRLDYDYEHDGGYFPVHVESNNDPEVARWLEHVIYVVPVGQRPPGYNPLGIQNLDPCWVQRLGQSGKDCYQAILARDVKGLGAAMIACTDCWAALLPHTLEHPTLNIDLRVLLRHYERRYAGAMYSGCGGGYIYVVSETPVPGGFQVRVRTTSRH